MADGPAEFGCIPLCGATPGLKNRGLRVTRTICREASFGRDAIFGDSCRLALSVWRHWSCAIWRGGYCRLCRVAMVRLGSPCLPSAACLPASIGRHGSNQGCEGGLLRRHAAVPLPARIFSRTRVGFGGELLKNLGRIHSLWQTTLPLSIDKVGGFFCGGWLVFSPRLRPGLQEVAGDLFSRRRRDFLLDPKARCV